MKPLIREFQYYLDNKASFVKRYNGRVIVLKNTKLLGVYDTDNEAIEASLKQGHKLGTFLVHLVDARENSHAIAVYTPGVVNVQTS